MHQKTSPNQSINKIVPLIGEFIALLWGKKKKKGKKEKKKEKKRRQNHVRCEPAYCTLHVTSYQQERNKKQTCPTTRGYIIIKAWKRLKAINFSNPILSIAWLSSSNHRNLTGSEQHHHTIHPASQTRGPKGVNSPAPCKTTAQSL